MSFYLCWREWKPITRRPYRILKWTEILQSFTKLLSENSSALLSLSCSRKIMRLARGAAAFAFISQRFLHRWERKNIPHIQNSGKWKFYFSKKSRNQQIFCCFSTMQTSRRRYLFDRQAQLNCNSRYWTCTFVELGIVPQISSPRFNTVEIKYFHVHENLLYSTSDHIS